MDYLFPGNPQALILPQAYKNGLYGPKIVWIMTGWYVEDWWSLHADTHDCTRDQMLETVQGMLYTGVVTEVRYTLSLLLSPTFLSLHSSFCFPFCPPSPPSIPLYPFSLPVSVSPPFLSPFIYPLSLCLSPLNPSLPLSSLPFLSFCMSPPFLFPSTLHPNIRLGTYLVLNT